MNFIVSLGWSPDRRRVEVLLGIPGLHTKSGLRPGCMALFLQQQSVCCNTQTDRLCTAVIAAVVLPSSCHQH